MFLLLFFFIPSKAGIQRLSFEDWYFTENLTGKALDYSLRSPFGPFAYANVRFGLRPAQSRLRGNDGWAVSRT